MPLPHVEAPVVGGDHHAHPRVLPASMPKQYLRYAAGPVLGVVCSRKTGALLLEHSTGDEKRKKILLAAAPALENVILWDLRKGEKVSLLCACVIYCQQSM